MAEYIEREAAIKALCNCKPHTCSIDDCEKGCQEVSAICAIPAADVAPVRHGKYITDDMGDSSCSECGAKWLDVTQNFCPNCGARMEE